MHSYDPRVTPWQIDAHDFPWTGPPQQQLQFLVRYAILAPSTRNTQPWKFAIGPDSIDVLMDTDRWQRVVDKDQRELHISLGCALENLLVAAEHFGYGHEVSYFPVPTQPELVANVKLGPDGLPSLLRAPSLFPALCLRHTNHHAYWPEPVPEEDLRKISDCCVEDGISLYLTYNPEVKRKVDAMVARADILEFADPVFREELAGWIGQGVFGTSWLVSVTGQLATNYLNLGGTVAKKDSDLLMSAPVLGVLAGTSSAPRLEVICGQVLERICLTASALGLMIQPFSQIVEVPDVCAELASLLPASGLRPLQPFRLGFGPPEPHHTPRRPVEEVLV